MCASFSVVSTLHDPMDRHPPGSSLHGILQARTLHWAAIPGVPVDGNGQERSLQKRQCLLGLASRRAEPGRGNLVQVIYRQRSEEARQEMRGVRQNRRPSWVPAEVQLSSQGAPWREWGLHQTCLSLSRRGQTSVLLPASHWLEAASQG